MNILTKVVYVIKVGDSYFAESEGRGINLTMDRNRAQVYDQDKFTNGGFESFLAKKINEIKSYGVFPKLVRLRQVVETTEHEVTFGHMPSGRLALIKVKGEDQ